MSKPPSLQKPEKEQKQPEQSKQSSQNPLNKLDIYNSINNKKGKCYLSKSNLRGYNFRQILDDIKNEKLNDKVTYISSNDNGLDKIGNIFAEFSKLEYLFLKNNKIQKIEKESFGQCGKLTELSLDKNQIVKIENLGDRPKLRVNLKAKE